MELVDYLKQQEGKTLGLVVNHGGKDIPSLGAVIIKKLQQKRRRKSGTSLHAPPGQGCGAW
jgi:hypothetical protein